MIQDILVNYIRAGAASSRGLLPQLRILSHTVFISVLSLQSASFGLDEESGTDKATAAVVVWCTSSCEQTIMYTVQTQITDNAGLTQRF